MSTKILVALWNLALLLAAAAAYLIFTSDHEDAPYETAALNIAVSLAFVAAGLIAWARRPENRTGVLMTAVGFTWFLGALSESNHSLVFTLGVALGTVTFVFFAWLILAFPSGRLESRLDRAIVTCVSLLPVAAIAHLMLDDHRDLCDGCPENAFLVTEAPRAATALELLVNGLALALTVSIVAILVGRWLRASEPLRRALSPVFVTSGAALVVLAVGIAIEAVGGDAAIVEIFTLAAILTVPIAFVLGLLRARLARAAVGRLVVELGEQPSPAELRSALARALRDPSLEVAYSLGDDRWVDASGRPTELPAEGSGRAVTLVEHEGQCVAALLHDPSVRDDPELLESVAAAAALALENERRLQALASSERRARALLEAMPDNMFRIARDGTYLDFYANNAADLIAPPDRILGSNMHDFLPPELARLVADGIERALDTGEVQTVEYQIARERGLRDVEARISRSGDDEAVVIVRDVTERRQRLAELERERDFVRTVVDSAPALFCVVDGAGRIIRFNSALEAMTGIPDDENARGRPVWEVFGAEEDGEEIERALREAAAGVPTYEREDRFATAFGDEAIVAWSVVPLPEVNGEPRFLICGLDVTERKRQEEELRASRTRIVEAGDAERRRLERNLHDGAQQRLVSLSLSLRLAEAKVESDPHAAVQLLALARDELAQALDELRELARGIHPAVLTDRGLDAALEAVAARAPVPVEIETPEVRLPTPVEAAAYYVVSEALANVAKYAQASQVSVTVARDDGNAVIEVQDDGIGGADPAHGSGLRGLADRVAALDGRLHVESEPGSGTRIRAEIPLREAVPAL